MTDLATAPGRLGRSVEEFTREYLENLRYLRGVERFATPNDRYQALAHTVRAYLMQAWLDSIHAQFDARAKAVCYLSAEYLPGRQLGNNLLNADLEEIARQAMAGLGLDLDELAAIEVEPGLGNGGLGRLAACFLDSLATLRVPAVGYGIRYEYGIFRQAFEDGWQVKQPDPWLRLGNPWEFAHPELGVEVGFGGRTEWHTDKAGQARLRWLPERRVLGVPYNVMVPGYRNGMVNTLRLWSARATHEFDLRIFNAGDYARAVQEKTASENIAKVLYPDDTTAQGQRLRLEQQYFLVGCALADVLRFASPGLDLARLPERIVIQLNDTHPALAVAELMRLLVDERRLGWEAAWEVCRQVFAYTLHTLMPEALETWLVPLFASLLPRHLQIVEEINRRFLAEVRARYPGDEGRVRRLSIFAEGGEKRVRMAHLAAVGSFKINGVAPLQSRLLAERTLRDFAELWPEKFANVTNGVSPRRFVRLSNPRLSDLITAAIGEGWITDLERLRELEPLAEDPAFRAEWRRVKLANKQELAAILRERTGVAVAPAALFDVMAKRLHEYKRQLLKLLHVLDLYDRLASGSPPDPVPRAVLFGAKAAPGYRMAKLIIRLINAVAEAVNGDPRVGDRLKVVFPPNFNVTLGERIYAAAELSEQLSLAGTEASGTGNMKLALNGAVTIGTLDGANIDIRERVGPESFFLYGLTEEDVAALRTSGYDPSRFLRQNPALGRAIDRIASGEFSPREPDLFRPLVDSLLHEDRYLVLADYASYAVRQEDVEQAYRNPERWTRMSILNTARCGSFSSDRSIREYCDLIWEVRPLGGPT